MKPIGYKPLVGQKMETTAQGIVERFEETHDGCVSSNELLKKNSIGA